MSEPGLLDPQHLRHDPKLASKYLITDSIGNGGMAQVFEAIRWSDGRRVAVKVLHPERATDERSRRYVLREAHALAVASHPGVVELIEYGETASGLPFLVLEWLEGRTVLQAILDEGPLPVPMVSRIIDGILEALQVIHSRGVVHADLKPDNVMLVRGWDGTETVRLIDFGVASIASKPAALPGEVCGTPGYIAPEVVTGQAPSPLADTYSAAVILFEMLTGCAAFVGSSIQDLLARQLYDEPPRVSDYRPGLGPVLDAVLQRALSPRPTARFAGAGGLRSAYHVAVSPAAHAAGLMRHTAPAPTRVPTADWRNGRVALPMVAA
jgi:serine/threonine protein kinase